MILMTPVQDVVLAGGSQIQANMMAWAIGIAGWVIASLSFLFRDGVV